VAAAASLADCPQPQVRRLLDELARAHLIAEHAPGRYAFHDLLRAYAAELTHRTDNQNDQDVAIGRVLDHYLHTAARASLLLDPASDPVALAPPRPGAVAGRLVDYPDAMAWFEAEHQVLFAAVALADNCGFGSHAWQLPWAMTAFLRNSGHWQDWAVTQRIALTAATRLGDTAGQALSGRLLAMACTYLGDDDQARRRFASSLTLYQRLGNRLGEAKVHHGLGVLTGLRGHSADSLKHNEQALRLCQALGDKATEAAALNNVGFCHGMLGDYEQARAFCQRSLTLCAETGDRCLEGNVWDSLGYAEYQLGNLAEAAACYQRALSLSQEIGHRFYESEALTHLGDTRYAAGDLAGARQAWQQALAILEDIRHPDADQMRAKLASTADQAAQTSSA
jgi:tetratricopeptide (TPR) repeat protein